MSRTVTQSLDGKVTHGRDSDLRSIPTADAESFLRHEWRGHHPVAIGDRLGSRYKILHNLGHYSWLARDDTTQRLVAVDVLTADMTSRCSEFLPDLRDVFKDDGGSGDGALGRDLIRPECLNVFSIRGPLGSHTCLVSDAAWSSLKASRSSSYARFIIPVAHSIDAQLVLALSHLDGKGINHGGEF